ncbi:methyl-accepting chemotaxis protein [Treponema primitia]|uniref:methyl-accepting chemotaxis protein n=1 Tax=Treponema primitia TaxID=88058 RepID=UPI00025557F7|nr:methyl-accepting chemotaxis protein [Treponema primitia]
MFYKNLKITTKLVFSSAVFILPIALMLFLIVSSANSSIRISTNEREGIGYLRPIAGLLRMVPAHLRMVLAQNTAAEGNGRVDQEITRQLDELIANLGETDGEPELGTIPGRRYVSGAELRSSWNSLKEIQGDPAVILNSYNAFIQDLYDLVSYIGDASSLIVDPELGTYYFAEISLLELPEIQQQILRISNLTYVANVRKVITKAEREELRSYMTLLSRSYTPRLRSATYAALANLRADPSLEALLSEELMFKNNVYISTAGKLTGILEAFLAAEDTPEFYYTEVINAAAQANDASYDLWLASLDQLDILLQQRIIGYRNALYRSLIFAVLTAVIAFIIVIITTANITKSTASLKQLFKSLDNNDLSLELAVHSKDEFGELMSAFNRFLGKLRSVFVSFSQDASRVSTSVFDLSASAKEITTTANEQSASVSEIVSTMEGSKEMSEQVAAKTAEVAELAVKTRELSQRGAELREANQEMMQDIRDQNNKIIDEIKNLAEMLSRISEAIGIIDNIADQTKLIAFNASLEASSSGEAGARFAVVASEIRRFADNVVDSTGEIKQRIEEAQTASQSLITEANNGSMQIDEGYDHMVEQKEVFENIVENSKNVAVNSQQISDLSRKQEFASAQIFTTLQEISAGVKQFVIAMGSTSKIADNLNVMSKELRGTVGLYATGDDKHEKAEKTGEYI